MPVVDGKCIPCPLGFLRSRDELLKYDIRVCSGADRMQVSAIDPVEQEPVRLNVTSRWCFQSPASG
jgi:hypothetical protein